MTTVAIYGQFDNHWSIAYVSRGLYAGLEALGFEPFCACDTAPQDMWLYETGGHAYYVPDALDIPWGAADPTWPAITIGYPPLASNAFWQHRVKVGLFVAESYVIPAAWGRLANRCDLVIPPSAWCADAYQCSGVDASRLLPVSHGIHPCYALDPPPPPIVGRPRFLHIAGSRDFIWRKGTLELIEACAELPVDLNIRTPPSLLVRDAVARARAGAKAKIVCDFHTVALAPERMRDYYTYGWTAVVQPSVAEAFGIVPVEARAMGIPVALTTSTGHWSHVHPSDYQIPVTERGLSRASNGIPDAVMDQVQVASIRTALEAILRDPARWQDSAIERARGVAATYRWGRVLDRDELLEVLRG